MWGGGGTGGSGGGGGLDPSALAGYATMGFVEDNYVSKVFFNQLFEYQYNHRVLTKDGETVVSDVTTAMVAISRTYTGITSSTVQVHCCPALSVGASASWVLVRSLRYQCLLTVSPT